MTDIEKKAFEHFKHDYKQAKNSKNTIDKLIIEWNDLYYGTSKKNKNTTKSKIVRKLVAKQIEIQKPNITEPFVSTSHPIRLVNGKFENRARIMQKWLNFEFAGSFDRETFMEQLTDVMLREGTVWVRTSWNFIEQDEIEELNNIGMEELLVRQESPDTIEQNEDGTFNVTFKTTKILKNQPDMEVCRNEHIFPDPSARAVEDCRFIIHRKDMTISELRASEIYDEEKLKSLESKVGHTVREDTDLGNVRDSDNRDYGGDINYQPLDAVRKKVKILEYWGYYDLNDDGIAEPIVATWADEYGVDLRVEENPLPSKNLPFLKEVYSSRPFSLWGNPLAFFIGDNQIAESAIMRGIFDNMSNSNNGQKFILRGSIDYTNMKKLKNGDKFIQVDKMEGIQDGKYNNIPPSVFQTLQMLTQESADLAGSSGQSPAVTNSSMAKDDSDAQLTMAQQRLISTIRGVSGLISKAMKEWLSMGEVFLTNEQIQNLFSKEDEQDIMSFKNSNETYIKLKVGSDVVRGQRINQLNLLMQQAKVLESGTPPDTISSLVAEMFELFDMYEKADSIRNFKPEPNPQQEMMQQIAMKKAQLELQEMEMDIQVKQNKMQVDMMNAQSKQYDSQVGGMYKTAQAGEKNAKTQGHEVDTALKPVTTMNDIRQTNKEQVTNE